MRTTTLILLLMLAVMLLLTACAPGSGHWERKPAGFFSGIWHGWIAPISLIWHLFDSDIRIYETNNTGGWYDLGFYIAVIGGFGGFALTRKRKCGKD
jgi:hypothetical protein